MITTRVDKCIFCEGKLENNDSASKIWDCLECVNESSHYPNKIWYWISEGKIIALNILIGEYQLCLDIKREETLLLKKGTYLVELNHLMDFSLDVETVKNKIQTLLTFS